MIEQMTSFTYRGSLKSCNYACSYCPFAKRPWDGKELSGDKLGLMRFGSCLDGISFEKPVSILLAPYGEAMIHPYYQEFLGELSKKEYIRRVGCQTNLSFSAEKCLELWDSQNADLSRIVLWATFHPEMTSAEAFAGQVRLLSASMNLSVGVVGNPEAMDQIFSLRRAIPPEIYLWINQMDGLGRSYTEEETAFFQTVDPLFRWELQKRGTPPCEGGRRHVFVDAKGRLYPCNRVKTSMGTLYESAEFETDGCSGARCDCYLAYSHLGEFQKQAFFGKDSLFRVPARRRLSAVFLDVDGTLTEKNGRISEETEAAVKYLAGRLPVYLATELPYEIVMKKCGKIMKYVSGGCFAGGAHIRDQDLEQFIELPELPHGLSLDRAAVYEREGRPYRILLPAGDCKDYMTLLQQAGMKTERQTGGMFSIISGEAGKAEGMKLICRQRRLDLSGVMAVGNSVRDSSMLQAAGYKIAVPGSDERLIQISDEVLSVRALAWIV